MNPVVHFEMPAEDKKRMRNFYENVFGWQTEQLGKDMGEYVLVTTSETDPNDPSGRPKMPGTINGGFYSKTDIPSVQNHSPSIVVAVESLEESIEKVEKAGGKISGQPQDIPGVGRFVSIIDTEGNRISMLQPEPM